MCPQNSWLNCISPPRNLDFLICCGRAKEHSAIRQFNDVILQLIFFYTKYYHTEISYLFSFAMRRMAQASPPVLLCLLLPPTWTTYQAKY